MGLWTCTGTSSRLPSAASRMPPNRNASVGFCACASNVPAISASNSKSLRLETFRPEDMAPLSVE